MKTILEISEIEECFEMPAEVYDAITHVLRHRLAKRVKDAAAMLPQELRDTPSGPVSSTAPLNTVRQGSSS